MRFNWKAVWLAAWFGFLIADQVFGLRGTFADWLADSERAAPDIFYRRFETALLTVFVLIAAAPIAWPLARRWFFKSADDQMLERDPRDVSVADALVHIARDSAFSRRFDEEDAEDADRLAAAAHAFEEAAGKGRIMVRGRRAKQQQYVEPIDRAYWANARLDMAETLKAEGSGGQTSVSGHSAGPKPPLYDNLIVDRETVLRLWPRDNAWRRTGRATLRGMAWSVGLRKGRNGKRGEGD